MNHTQRHWRATQLADTIDPFTLKEALHRATMPFEYVHRAESRRLEREEEADKIWAWMGVYSASASEMVNTG
jgi:hypothetical protein